jgi:hypothetical protein
MASIVYVANLPADVRNSEVRRGAGVLPEMLCVSWPAPVQIS